MRTTLRYAAAIGVMAASFGTLGSASASAGQIPSNPSHVSVVQQTGSQDKQMGTQYRRYCRYWGRYGYGRMHGHRYCRTWGYYR